MLLLLFACIAITLVIVSSLLITEIGNILVVKEGRMMKRQQLNIIG
jgi:hypothetical protein